MNRNTARDRSNTWLDNEGDAIVLKLPDCVVGKPSVGQRCLCPTTVVKADLPICIGHVADCSLNHVPSNVRAQYGFFAVLHKEAMNVTHSD